MNEKIENNYKKLKLSLFFLPFFLLILIVVFLYQKQALTIDAYVQIQKKYFYYINSELSQFPQTEYNLTQFGDAFVFLSISTIFFVYCPKIWEYLITATLISALFSKVLKMIFHVPRPASILNHDTFVIIGQPLLGNSNSLPSGHAITVFTILTIFMYGFMPQKSLNKFLWIISFLFIGLVLVFTRVGVGAHFPLDVIVGSIVGYISSLLCVFIHQKYTIFRWVSHKKYKPIFILLFFCSAIIMMTKIMDENLILFYLALISLLFSLFITIKTYVKK